MLDPGELRHEPSLAKAATLPSRWYVDGEALRLEKERIFATTWQCVGPIAKVKNPGDYFTAEVVGEPIVVVRGVDGRLRGFYNVCRHRGGPVAQGEGNGKLFKCAYHGWLYGLDGELRTTPEFAGVECFERQGAGLPPIQVDTWGPFVFVKLAAGGSTLAATLGKIPEETRSFPIMEAAFHKRVVYELACNWKTYIDNYLEGYHIPQVHPGLMKELDYGKYRVECERYYSKQHAPVRRREGSLFRRHLPEGMEAQALYYWIFPNLMLNIYPDNIQINLIVPTGAQTVATVFDWYLADEANPQVRADFAASLAFSDTVQKEDILICEAVQKGLASRSYDQGRYSVEREAGVHHFHGLYVELMRG